MLAGRKIYLLNCVRVNDLILQELLNSLFLPVWLCSATKRISPAFFFSWHPLSRVLPFRFLCPISLVCFGLSFFTCLCKIQSCAASLVPPLPSCSGFWGWKQKGEGPCGVAESSPALWLQELLIHVQLCVKWIRGRVNQSTQEIYLLQVSEMCEEKV